MAKLHFKTWEKYFLTGVFGVSVMVYFVISTIMPAGISQTVRLEQVYALIALSLLYITLLASPLHSLIPHNTFLVKYTKSKNTFLLATFYIALLHTLLAFFGQLGGFNGLWFLSNTYIIAISLSFTALLLLFILTLITNNILIKYEKAKKYVQIIGYLSGIFILIHALMLGSQFSDISGLIPVITFIALAFLLLLHSYRLDAHIAYRTHLPRFGVVSMLLLLAVTSLYFFYLNPFTVTSTPTLDIHAAHKQLAQQAIQNSQQVASNIPALQGDRNRRYSVSFDKPDSVQPNTDTTLHFSINDAANGSNVSIFRIIYAKPMHLIIVNNQLDYFSHIHPVEQGNDFSVTTQFPAPGLYRLYIDFQPLGAIEQQFAFTVPVGITDAAVSKKPDQKVDTNLTKTFGAYEVTLDTHGELKASDMSLGNQKLSFTIRDAKTKKPITTLKPYLASFGHLSMIDEDTHNFIHVHPYNLIVPPPDANGGPIVDFLPIGIYGPFKPGIYKVYAEFNPDNHLITTDFTVEVK